MKKVNFFPIFIGLLLSTFTLVMTNQSSADLIGQWLFDEGSGAVAKDTSGNSNDGEFIGTPKWVKGKFGTALEFDGESFAVKVTPGIFAENFTVVLWLYSEIEWGEKRTDIFHFRDVLLIRGDDRDAWAKGEAMLHWNDGANWLKIPSGKLDAKTWYHLAGSFDGTNLKFYLNGKLAGSEATAIKEEAKDSFIGAHPVPTNWWHGLIDEVAVFDTVLTKGEIDNIINRGLEKWMAVDPSEKMATRWATIKN